tara:strand:- start:1997 stop:2251 length:255 start_codon:yes stop_codon:yes gene_type:complete
MPLQNLRPKSLYAHNLTRVQDDEEQDRRFQEALRDTTRPCAGGFPKKVKQKMREYEYWEHQNDRVGAVRDRLQAKLAAKQKAAA